MSAVPRGIVGAEVIISFTVISTLFLCARLYTRYVLVKNSGWEDIAIIFAWVFSVINTALMCVEVWRGLGDDIWNLSAAEVQNQLLPFWVDGPMYALSIFLTKISIVLMYIRLFPEKRFVKACRIINMVMGAFLFWTIFGFMFICTPVKYFWDKSIKGGHCFDTRWVYFTNAPFNILTDFVLFGLPLPTLLGLQLPHRQRMTLVIIFGIGLVGCLTSILRLRSLYILSVSKNITHDNLETAIWSAVEINVGICCACGPTLKALIHAVIPQLLSTPSKATKRERPPVYGMNPLGSEVNITKHTKGTQSHANFEEHYEIQAPEVGKVRVTTDVWQEVDAKSESRALV